MVGRIPSETNYDAFEADYLTYGTSALRPWVSVVRSCHSLPRLMGYAALPSTYRSAIWAKFAEVDSLGFVPDLLDIAAAPAPDRATDGDSRVALTLAEVISSYASKVAHCFWLEKNKTFPWRLSSMSDEALSWLVDPTKLYPNFNSATGGDLDYLIDHTPYRVWNLRGTGAGGTLEGFAGALMADAVKALEDYSIAQYVHTQGEVGGEPEYAYHADDMENLTFNGRNGSFIFNRCYAMARIFAGWCRCLNIPADPDTAASYMSLNHGNVRVYMDGDWWVTVHADHLGGSGYSVKPRGRSPLGYWGPWDDTYQALGYGAGFKWYLDNGYSNPDPELTTYSRTLNGVNHFGGPNAKFSPDRVGYINPGAIADYTGESPSSPGGWAWLNNPDNNDWTHPIAAHNENVRLRLIKITGQDIP